MAELYRQRWTLETAFQHLEAYFHSEINTLGYPKAALFGFCLALGAYNLLAVVLAALRGVHGAETVDEEVSLYYIANEITTTYHGMMIAIPEPAWDVFYSMSLADLAAILLELAQKVRLQAIRKSPRRSKPARVHWSTVFWTPLDLKLCSICQGTSLLLSHLGRGFVAMPSNEPGRIILTLKRVQRQAQLFYRIKRFEPYQILLQCPDEAFRAAVAFGFPDKGGRTDDPQKSQFLLKHL